MTIGSGLAAPGVRSTCASIAATSARRLTTVVGWSADIDRQLLLVAQDALWPEDDQQHQRDTDDDPAELLDLLGPHDALRHPGAHHRLDEHQGGPEDDRAEHRPEDGR